MGIYSPIVTNSGSAAIASARASGGVIKYAQFAVGDSNGVYYAPSASQTALVHEVWRGNINPVDVYVHPNNPNWLVVAAHIPVTDGGFDIREAAVFSDSGVMIAVSRYPLTTKPAYGSGSEKDILVKMIMEVTNAAEVTQFVDPSLIFTTKEYVDSRFHFVRLAATANISSMSGTQTIDGVDAAIGDRILVTAQATGSQNGIYVVSSGAWTRALDFNSNENIVPSTLITVAEGNTYKDTLWMLASDSVVLNVTSFNFIKLFPDESQRTIVDTEIPTGNVASTTKLLSWLANMVKSITGKSNWRTPPSMSLEEAKTHVNATSAHGATSSATASSIMFRDGNGYSNVSTPLAGDNSTKIATTAFVEPKVDKLQTLTSAINLDTLKTTGFFINPTSTNATGNNYPEISAGYLSVVGNGVSAEQTYVAYNSTKQFRRFCINDGTWTSWGVVWDAGSDGAGSGLDADMLDGLSSNNYVKRWHVGVNTDTARWMKLCSIADGSPTGSRMTLLLSGAVNSYGSNAANGHAVLDLTLLNSNVWAASLFNTGGYTTYAIVAVKIVSSSGTAADIWIQALSFCSISASLLGNNDETFTAKTGEYSTTAPTGSPGYIYTMWHSGNDGAGSGLDAGLLGGLYPTDFVRRWVLPESSTPKWFKVCSMSVNSVGGTNFRLAANDAHSYTHGFNNTGHIEIDVTLDNAGEWNVSAYQSKADTARPYAITQIRAVPTTGSGMDLFVYLANNTRLSICAWGSDMTKITPVSDVVQTSDPGGTSGTIFTMWHSGNDGAGSGLDADKLDGQEGTYYATVASLTGAVAYFAMSTPPTGWLPANGAAVSRTTYAALFTAIGTTYGAGNGSTTFNLPDLRGEFLRGWDNGRGVDSGRIFGSYQAHEIISHAHTLGHGGDDYNSGATNQGWTGIEFGGVEVETTSYYGGTETRPRNIALLACIKY